MFVAVLAPVAPNYIARAYGSDPALVAQWHVTAGAGLDRCVERTLKDLRACPSLEFYVVKENDDFVGYFGTEFGGSYLTTIFVHPNFRERKDEFWKLIEAKTLPRWKGGIYEKNIPCRRFYSKHGREIARVNTANGPGIIFQFEAGEVCR